MSNLKYYGIYQSPSENNGNPYIGEPEASVSDVYKKSNTSGITLITYFTTEEEAKEYIESI